jgi:DNA-binding NarL/FixJ family response regulator
MNQARHGEFVYNAQKSLGPRRLNPRSHWRWVSEIQVVGSGSRAAVSPALTAARVPLPFTRREHEIATLLSGGLSNRDIAEATSQSIRTVEGHIYQASSKAGVSSRSELSTLVRQFNGV